MTTYLFRFTNWDVSELQEVFLSTVGAWFTSFVESLPRILVAIVAGFLFYGLAKLAGGVTSKTMKRANVRTDIVGLASRAARFTVLGLGMMVCLSILNLDQAVTSLLAGAGVIGLALGFAFQDLTANFISGVGLTIKHPFKIGDIIETNGVVGIVEEVTLRTTSLRTFDGKRISVPNKKLFEEVLLNHTDNYRKRVDVGCGVAYDSNLDEVERVVIEALESVEVRCVEMDPQVYFQSFGGSSIDFQARVWIDYQRGVDLLAAKDQMIRAIKEAFDANGISIPFPTRTLMFEYQPSSIESDRHRSTREQMRPTEMN